MYGEIEVDRLFGSVSKVRLSGEIVSTCGRLSPDMSVDVYTKSDPTSHELSRVITALDETSPKKYHVRWESEKRNPKTTYDVDEFHFGNGPKMKILGQIENSTGKAEYLIDSNPPGQPQVVHIRNDGYESRSRLVEIKVISDDFEWRHKLQFVSQELRHKLNFPAPETDGD